jgi:putative ABC transport system permease protein
MMADLRAAIRTLAASRTFTAVTVLVLTLGIGAVASVFAVVDAVLLRRLPFEAPERLVAVREHDPAGPPDGFRSLTAQNYRDWAAARDVFESVAATYPVRATTIDAHGGVEELRQLRATASLFDVLRLRVAVGRPFGAEAESDGRHRVAVISDGLWRRRFGGAPDVLGTTLALDGEPFEIIGVLAPGVRYPPGASGGTDVFVPYVVPPGERERSGPSAHYLQGIGRLAPGVTLEQTRTRLRGLTEGLHRAYPGWNTEMFPQVLPYEAVVVGPIWRSWLLLLLATAGVVLLIAAVNLAMLQLARGPARQREMAVRAAMGGSRWRLARQVLIENVVLTLLAGVSGLLLARWATAVAVTGMPGAFPRMDEVNVDVRVAAVVAAGAVLVGLASGLVPALRRASAGRAPSQARAAPRSTAREGRGWRAGLVVAEVALAVPLLVGAALLVRTFVAVATIDPGADLSNLLIATVSRPAAPGGSLRGSAMSAVQEITTADVDRYLAIVDRATSLAGVERAAVAIGGVPMGGSMFGTAMRAEGRPDADAVDVVMRRVSPEYFATFRIALEDGRGFTPADRALVPPPAVINAAAARAAFGTAPALNRTIEIGGILHAIVGVAADVRQRYAEPPQPEAVVPVWVAGRGLRASGAQIVLRLRDPGVSPLAALRRLVSDEMPGAAIRAATTGTAQIENEVKWRRYDTTVLGALAAMGLVIATIGVYGALAYAVAHRTREIGIHIALGARASAVVRAVVGETCVLVAVGLAVGGGAAWILARVVELQLLDVEPRDPLSFALAMATMAGAALVASLVPARRATRVDPVEALRAE